MKVRTQETICKQIAKTNNQLESLSGLNEHVTLLRQASKHSKTAENYNARTLPKNTIELKLKEIGKSFITVGWETRPYPFDNKLQWSGLCILRGKHFIAFCVKSTKTTNNQNKEVKSTLQPCLRTKEQSLKSHLECSESCILFSASIRPYCRS